LEAQENKSLAVKFIMSVTTEPNHERCSMTKTITAFATAAVLGLAAVAAPQPAQARGGAVAAGIIGGLAAGAIIGAAAAQGPYYGPAYYGPGPAYYGPDCYWTHQRFWTGYGWAWRRVRVCH
jgi:hypothetical protein